MFGLGMSEIILLGIIALVVIGPKELPQLARTIGRFMNELKRSTNVLSDEIKEQVRIDEDLLEQKIRQRREELHNESAKTQLAEESPLQEDIDPIYVLDKQTSAAPEQLSFSDSTEKDDGKKS